ncbi:MAG: DUF523 domain-containing protein [Gammaproteobacteria bacterium]|nr:DUF523 domain-containing protein [Gammaproteobacteria bacterium]
MTDRTGSDFTAKPKIGISRCLLGDPVRYDGQSKPRTTAVDRLADHFQLIPICPEVEAGLPTPRPPVRLTGSIEHPRVTGRDQPGLDITELMAHYCREKTPDLNQLSGFILKSRSPSCGLHSTPVFIDDECVTETSSGVFARAVQAAYPELVLIEETGLEEAGELEGFIAAVLKRAACDG